MKRIFGNLAIGLLILCVSASVARAAVFKYYAKLDGPTEPSDSPGTGIAHVQYDNVAHTLFIAVNFQGLNNDTSASHIHAPTAAALTGAVGVATTTPSFAGFPNGVRSGYFSNTLNLTLASSYNPSFVSSAAGDGTLPNAELRLTQAIADGKAYWNIHSLPNYGSGEIRGFLIPVPEPNSLVLTALAIVGACLRRRRK